MKHFFCSLNILTAMMVDQLPTNQRSAVRIPSPVRFLKHFLLNETMKVVSFYNIFNLFRDTLLPLVHQVWQPLKLLFDSDNIFVVAEAFKVLKIFASHAKDFIHRRTVQEVFPAIVKYLHKLKVILNET